MRLGRDVSDSEDVCEASDPTVETSLYEAGSSARPVIRRRSAVRLAIEVSNLTLAAESHPARLVDTEGRPPAGRATGEPARAYRAGRLVCGCVHVTVSLDDRLGLTQYERRVVRVRFNEPLDDGLRAELAQLVRRRGAAARRVADSFPEIVIALDEPYGDRVHVIGRLQAPQVRHGQLRDIEFGLRESKRTR